MAPVLHHNPDYIADRLLPLGIPVKPNAQRNVEIVRQSRQSQSPDSMEYVSENESDVADFVPEDDFDVLINDIKAILGPTSGLDSAEVDVEHLMSRIRSYASCKSDWVRYAFADEAFDYTRNGVDDINHKANLLILVWTPQRGSKIHDHANAHCIVKMLEGTLRETLYDMPDASEPEKLQVKQVTDYQTDQVSYMSDTIGLHRMENPSNTYAVSLHLYTPPYAAKFGCNVYNEKSGERTRVAMSTLYSDRGVKSVSLPCSC